jgi:hypothetical protein
MGILMQSCEESQMKLITLCTISCLFLTEAFAADVISRQRFIRIMPVYQRWTIAPDTAFSELSIPVMIYLPVRYNWSVSLSGSRAAVKGDDFADLNGLADTQLSTSYHVESANLLLSFGVNLPSGKSALTLPQLTTSAVLSSNVFQFQVPNFGQGLNISPGFTWALPVRENFVLGFGGSYQYKGQFAPLTASGLKYDPGDEMLLTGGFDTRLSTNTTLTGDVIFTFYGKDKINGGEILGPGNKLVANLQFRRYFGFNELGFLARYRSRAKNDLLVNGVLTPENVKTNPDQVEVAGHYHRRFTSEVAMRFFAEGRFYQNTPAVAGVKLFGAGLAPSLTLSENFQLLAQLKYQTGSFKEGASVSGLEAGAGLLVNF